MDSLLRSLTTTNFCTKGDEVFPNALPTMNMSDALTAHQARVSRVAEFAIEIAVARGFVLSEVARASIKRNASAFPHNEHGLVPAILMQKDTTLGDVLGHTTFYGSAGPGPKYALFSQVAHSNQLISFI